MPRAIEQWNNGRARKKYKTQKSVAIKQPQNRKKDTLIIGVAVDYQYEIDVTKSKSSALHSVI